MKYHPIIYLVPLLSYFIAWPSVARDVVDNRNVNNKNITNKYPVKMIYFNVDDAECEIREFEVKASQIRKLATPDICPDKVYISGDQSSIMLLTVEYLQQVLITPKPVVMEKIPLPEPKVKKDTTAATPSYAGTTSDGLPSVVMESYYPYDDSNAYLYIYQDGKWILKGEKYCQKYEACTFPEITTLDQSKYTWKELQVWHDSQNNNPYVHKRVTRKKDEPKQETTGGYAVISNFGVTVKESKPKNNNKNRERRSNTYQEKIIFRINGNDSVISYSARPSEHTYNTYTMEVSLEPHGKENIILTDRQCNASVVGKYLYLRRYWDAGNELFDIETGDSVLGFIEHARWLYR